MVAGAEEQRIIITRTTSRLVTLPGHHSRVQSLQHLTCCLWPPWLENCPGLQSLEVEAVGRCCHVWCLRLYFSTSFSRRFVIVTIQSTYLIIIINYIYSIYSISTISTVYLQYLQYIYNLRVLSILSTVLLPGHVRVEAWVAPTPAHTGCYTRPLSL